MTVNAVSLPTSMRQQRQRLSKKRVTIIVGLFAVSLVIKALFQHEPGDPATKKAVAKLNSLGQTPLLDHAASKDPWKQQLFGRLDRIRANCGQLCGINDVKSMEPYTLPGDQAFRQLRNIPVDCRAIMLDEDIDVGDLSVPHPPPDELIPYYSMHGAVNYALGGKHNNVYLGGNQSFDPQTWTPEYLASFLEQRSGDYFKVNYYRWYGRYPQMLRNTIHKYIDMNGTRVLVVGSERPWVEAICLKLGAAHVTTLEYGRIDNTHPQITTRTPGEFRELYRTGKLEPFDVVVSFSSLEHPGLGRYGDSLNPWGDLLALARAKCVTKPGGYLALAVPTGSDKVNFNAERQYWLVRYPLLTANWARIDNETIVASDKASYQPTLIFQNQPT